MEGQKPEAKSDEIDLGQLFSRMGDSMRSGWMAFMRFLALMRRIPIENKLSFSLIIIASVSVGVIISVAVRKRFYETRMVISSDYLNKKLAENIVDKLDALTGEESRSGLVAALGLPDSVCKKIIGFDVKPFMVETDLIDIEILKEKLKATKVDANADVIDEIMERIEVENRHAYEITVRTTSPSIVSKLETAVVGYFGRNPYIAKRVEINHQVLLDLKDKVAKDISKMDSLKTAIYMNYKQMATQSKGSNNVIFGDKAVSDPVEIFTKSIDIYEVYAEVNQDLYIKKDFEVIDGFTQSNEPANASIFTIILESILIGVLVAYADVGLRSFNKYLANLN